MNNSDGRGLLDVMQTYDWRAFSNEPYFRDAVEISRAELMRYSDCELFRQLENNPNVAARYALDKILNRLYFRLKEENPRAPLTALFGSAAMEAGSRGESGEVLRWELNNAGRDMIRELRAYAFRFAGSSGRDGLGESARQGDGVRPAQSAAQRVTPVAAKGDGTGARRVTIVDADHRDGAPDRAEEQRTDAAALAKLREEREALDGEIQRMRAEKAELERENQRLRQENAALAATTEQAGQDARKAKERAEYLVRSARERARSLLDDAMNTAVSAVPAGSGGRQKAEMEQSVQRLESDLVQELDRFGASLKAYRDGLEKQLYDMRREMYKGDFTELTGAYRKLWDYVCNKLTPRAEETEGEVRSELDAVLGALTKRLAGLQSGMRTAGITMILPGRGEIYNENEHVAENGSNVDDEAELRIVRTVKPGFRKDGYVICRASVWLDLPDGNGTQED